MTSFRFGPFVGRFVGEWGNTSVLVIAHVWAPYRSLAEIYVSRPVDQCDLEVFKSAILSWLDAGELNLLDDLRGLAMYRVEIQTSLSMRTGPTSTPRGSK